MRIAEPLHTRRADSSRAGFGSLALWVGIWAIVISLIALYLGIDARNVARDSERRMARNVELLDESRSKIESLEVEIREFITLTEQRLNDVSFTVEQNQTRIKTNSLQLASTRKVASELIDGLTSQKEAITELATRIPAIPEDVQTERTRPPRPVPSPTARTQPPGQTASAQTTPPTRTPEPAPAPAPKPRATYTVKSGDTLVDIARRKNLSVPDLLDANPDIDPNIIRVGQKLNLPE
ncbi:MAG: LysM peptidoglycan-binding domain-containing protein [Puniceicoccales bacterium]